MPRQTVLAIEHCWRLRKLIKANLETVGFRVREAVSEQHGRQCLGEERPDLILLDLDLPGGLDLLWEMRRQFAARPVPVILLSTEPLARHILQRTEAAAHLIKPFGVLNLLEEVEGLLGAPPAES